MKKLKPFFPASLGAALVAATLLAPTARADEHEHGERKQPAGKAEVEVCCDVKPEAESECCEVKEQKEKKQKKAKKKQKAEHRAARHGHAAIHPRPPHPPLGVDVLIPKPPFHAPPGARMETRPFPPHPGQPPHMETRREGHPPGPARQPRVEQLDGSPDSMRQRLQEQEGKIRHMAEAAEHLKAAGLGEHAEKLRGEIGRLREQLAEAEQQLERQSRERQSQGHRDGNPQPGPTAQRLEAQKQRLTHLAEAVEHLQAAGMEEPAAHFKRQLIEMRRHLSEAFEKSRSEDRR